MKRPKPYQVVPDEVVELSADLRAALDLLLLMLNEDGAGDLNWDVPPLKGTIGWEIRQLIKKYGGKLK